MTAQQTLRHLLKFLDEALECDQFSAQKQAHVQCLPGGSCYVSLFPGLVGCFVVYLPKGTEGACKHNFQKYRKVGLKVWTMETTNYKGRSPRGGWN